MSKRLKDRKCLITGASGIAAAAAVAAAAEGAAVFIISRLEAECQAVVAALPKEGGACDYAVADLSSEAEVVTAMAKLQQRFGRLDGVLNVAGISGRAHGDGPAHLCTMEGWQTTLRTNLDSVFLVCRAGLKMMLEQAPGENGQRGAVVSMTSVLAFSPRADHFATHAYAASKGAIISLTASMAAYYAPHKIRINAIAPGLVRTPMSRRAQEDTRIVDLLNTRQPLAQGFIEPQEIAAAAVFLLSDQASSITGVTLPIDAGWCVSC